MPRGKTKFQSSWLDERDTHGEKIKTWCVQGRDEFEAFCTLCKKSFQVDNSGKHQILHHSSIKKHTEAWKSTKGGQTILQMSFSRTENNCETTLQSNNTCSMSNKPRSICVALNEAQESTRAEAIWCLKLAKSNYSFSSCSDLGDLFSLMFPNYRGTANFKLSERKASYNVTYGLAPYFVSLLLQDVKHSGGTNLFTIAFDETTTSQIKKQMDIHLRYWSYTYNRVVVAYLTSVFLGHADAKLISSKLVEVLKTHNLPLQKLLMLSMDGPNVNKLVEKLMNAELKKIGAPELVNVGTCSLHQVHNAFADGLDVLELNIDEFATDLYSFLKLSAARREDVNNLQESMGIDNNFLLRHVSSRWLTLEKVVERILQQYEVLLEYFLNFLPKSKTTKQLSQSARFQRICKHLKDPSTKVYLCFLKSVSPTLNKYLALFQTEGPLIHLLYNKMNEFLRNILSMFLKDECLSSLEGRSLQNLDLQDSSNFTTLKKMDIGINTRRTLASSEIKEDKQKLILMNLRSSLQAISQGLQSRLPLANILLRDLQILHPLMRTSENTHQAVQRLCINLKPLRLTDEQIDNTVQEWRLYCTDSSITSDWFIEREEIVNGIKEITYKRIDLFWDKVMKILNDVGKPKYLHLSLLIRCCLTLGHGNADPERGFSVNSAMISKERGSLCEQTIVGLRVIKDAIRRHGGEISNIPITGKLLTSVQNSHKLYSEYLKNEKIKKEEGERKKVEEKNKKLLASENLKRKSVYENRLKILKQELADLQQVDAPAAQALLKEGSQRLNEALKKEKYNPSNASLIDGR